MISCHSHVQKKLFIDKKIKCCPVKDKKEEHHVSSSVKDCQPAVWPF